MATQMDNSPKSSVKVVWTPPESYEGTVIFMWACRKIFILIQIHIHNLLLTLGLRSWRTFPSTGSKNNQHRSEFLIMLLSTIIEHCRKRPRNPNTQWLNWIEITIPVKTRMKLLTKNLDRRFPCRWSCFMTSITPPLLTLTRWKDLRL